jgi:ABC-type Na+ efflux pump permease subunit
MTVALREYRAMVGTKAFLFSLAMMPILMFGGILAIDLMKKTDTIDDRRIVVIDHSGQFFQPLSVAAEAYNAALDAAGKSEDEDGDMMGRGDRYHLESLDPALLNDEKRLELSNQVRNQKLYAFVEIPADVRDAEHPEPVRFHASDAPLSQARRWLGTVLNELISHQRLQDAGIDPSVVRQASRRVDVSAAGLFSKGTKGSITAEEEGNEMTAIFLPLMVMMLMFMVIFMAAQPMLESVLEEKSSRVVEVLLGSVNPTQLMTGKLLGTVGGSLTILSVYLLGTILAAQAKGVWTSVPWDLLPWFLLFQILGVLFFAAIFMAVGSAVSQLKEAQSMLLPVWLLMMIPMFVWFQIVREPNGPLATGLSWLPPATPSTMLLRMATGVTIPLWQIVGTLVMLLVTTALCVVVAGRIFRVGILWQGKTPKLREMIRWGLARSI